MAVSIFLYTRAPTLLHRLDPRAKILAMVLLFGLALTFNHPLYLGVAMLAVLTIAWRSASLANVWRLKYMLLILMTFSTVLWPFFAPGTTEILRWWKIRIYLESLLYGAGMGLRIATFLIVGIIFLSTTRTEEFTAALIKLRVPYPMAFAVSTAFRLLPTFVGTGATIVQAQTARGLDLESGSVITRMRKFIPLLVPILIYALRSINLQAMALESKNFGGQGRRTFYLELNFQLLDYVVVFLLALVCGVALYLRLSGYGAVLPRL